MDKGSISLSYDLLLECFEDVDPRFPVLRMKPLYQRLKRKLDGSLTIKEFHQFLTELRSYPNQKIQLSRGSSVVPGTLRYGLKCQTGIYNYVQILSSRAR